MVAQSSKLFPFTLWLFVLVSRTYNDVTSFVWKCPCGSAAFFFLLLCVKSTGKVEKQWTTENKATQDQITNFSNNKPEKKNDVERRCCWEPFNFLFTCSLLFVAMERYVRLLGGLTCSCIPFLCYASTFFFFFKPFESHFRGHINLIFLKFFIRVQCGKLLTALRLFLLWWL